MRTAITNENRATMVNLTQLISIFGRVRGNSWIVLLLAEEQSTKQTKYHKARKRTYAEEYELFIKRNGLEWRSEKNH
jgi:hypothetical protein